MSTLPVFKDDNKNLMLLQTQWGNLINPTINNPLMNGNFIKGINVGETSVAINHGLGRKYQGYIITRQYNGFSVVIDALGQNPAVNIELVANGPFTTIDIYVF